MTMLHLSILLLLHHTLVTTALNLTSGCRTGTAAECKRAPFIPGHTLLGKGIDIVTMKPTGSSLFEVKDIDKKCTLCPNPYNDNVLQKLPKTMVDWRALPPCPMTIASSIHPSSISLANDATSIVNNNWKRQLDVEDDESTMLGAAGGSHCDVAKFAKSKGMNDKYSFISHKMQCSYYSFSLCKEPALRRDFDQTLRKLPAAYDDYSRVEYRRLISRFGTHYITQAEVGGQAQEVTAVKTCEVVMDGITVDEIKDCLGAEAELSIIGGYPSARMSEKLNRCSEKVKHGRSYHQIFNEQWWQVNGENTDLSLLSGEGSTEKFNKWLEMLKTRPGLVSYSLEPIHNLVRFRGPQKENLRLAISDYMKENALVKKCSCSGQAPSGDDGQAPSGDDGQAPSGDDGQATSGDDGQATSGDDGQTPPGDNGQAPIGDEGQAPSLDDGQEPIGDDGQAPSGDDGQAPSGDDGQAPPGDDCSCSCPGAKLQGSHCCATSTGEAELSVTILDASGLWGDYITKTDAYVKIKFDNIAEKTETIWNDDNPKWDQTFTLGTVRLAANKKITVEVWDEDNKHDDDLLGKCQETVTSGESSHICKLKHGSLRYSLSAVCSYPLKGQFCQDTPESPK